MVVRRIQQTAPISLLRIVHFFYKFENMEQTLSTLEQHLLLAILGLHPNAYGISIQEHIRDRTGREPSTGSIYASLDRLEEKGFIKSRQGEATAERGGKRKLYFTVTARGQHTLRASLQAIDSLSHGLVWKGAAS
jgi:PadR family transcriptional regulator, regulatory protein PadR